MGSVLRQVLAATGKDETTSEPQIAQIARIE